MWHNFPYSDTEDLNMDWVLNVVKKTENVIHNINDIVATYVGNMTSTLRGEINAGANRSMAYAYGVESRTETKMEKLKGDVNKRIYDAERFMRKTYADIVADNDKTENIINDELLKNRNEREDDKRKIWSELGKTVKNVNIDISMLKLYVENEIYELKEYINNQIDEQRNLTDRKIFALFGRIDDLQMEIEDVQKWVNRTLDCQFERVESILEQYRIEVNAALEGKADKDKVDADIARLEEAIKNIDVNIDVNTSTVFNPVTNSETDINTALSDIWNGHEQIWSLTAGEYDELQISAGRYDKFAITAWEYDNLSRWFLLIKPQLIKHFHRDIKRETDKIYAAMDKMESDLNGRINSIDGMISKLSEKIVVIEKKIYDETHMRSPISGNVENLKDVIRELVGEMQRNNSLTAEMYEDLRITAGKYDSLNITAYQYDWKSRSINWN